MLGSWKLVVVGMVIVGWLFIHRRMAAATTRVVRVSARGRRACPTSNQRLASPRTGRAVQQPIGRTSPHAPSSRPTAQLAHEVLRTHSAKTSRGRRTTARTGQSDAAAARATSSSSRDRLRAPRWGASASCLRSGGRPRNGLWERANRIHGHTQLTEPRRRPQQVAGAVKTMTTIRSAGCTVQAHPRPPEAVSGHLPVDQPHPYHSASEVHLCPRTAAPADQRAGTTERPGEALRPCPWQ